MDSSDLSSADKKRAASVILSAVEDAASKLLDSVDKPTAFQTKSHTIRSYYATCFLVSWLNLFVPMNIWKYVFFLFPTVAMFHVLDSTSATDLKFNSDDGDAEFFIPQYLIKHYSKSKNNMDSSFLHYFKHKSDFYTYNYSEQSNANAVSSYGDTRI